MISIIVPIYNSEVYLDRCINSLSSQTYDDLDIILVDDGSTDGSLDICWKWKKKDQRIRLFHQSNRGVSSARNIGIKNATGDYVILVDSDDWLALDSCEKLLSVMQSSKADCVIYGLTQTSGNIWAPPLEKKYENQESFQHDFIYWLDTELLSSSVNKIYKKSKINILYPENISYGEDLIFVLNYLKNCERIVFIKNPFYQHEVYNYSSLTHLFDPERFSNLEQIQQSIMSFADEKEQINIRIFDKYVRDAVRCIRMLYKRNDIPVKEKTVVLQKWFENAYLKKLAFRNFPLSWKDMIILCCLKVGFYLGIEWIVNGKEYFVNIVKCK